jgi:hypothetical protein
MNLISVISSELDSMQRRIIKFLRVGKRDVRTSVEVSPYGIDSNPIKGMVAVYGETGQNGQTVIIGYMNKKQLADVGDIRIYSTDSDGALKFYTWLKNDGTCELGGSADNAVRYSKLNAALGNQVIDINAELNKIAVAIAALGGTYIVAPISLDISQAKINEIKTL